MGKVKCPKELVYSDFLALVANHFINKLSFYDKV